MQLWIIQSLLMSVAPIMPCLACQKQETKCYLSSAAPPCARCKQWGLFCVVNRTLPIDVARNLNTNLPHPHRNADEPGWKATVEQKLRVIEGALNPHSGIGLRRFHTQEVNPTQVYGSAGGNLPSEDPLRQHQHTWEITMGLNVVPAVVPPCPLSEVSSLPFATQHQKLADEPDIIDRGLITLEDTESFFSLYQQCLDRFLYNILAEHDSLASVRKSSSLLTAVICVVGALHTSSPQYRSCYQYFVQLASLRMFSKRNTSDDVRALCIGASWLSDVSSTLIGTGMFSGPIVSKF